MLVFRDIFDTRYRYAGRRLHLFLLFLCSAVGAQTVQNRFRMIDHKAVMFQQMLAQLIQIVTADMEQPAAAGSLQVKMLLAQMRLIG